MGGKAPNSEETMASSTNLVVSFRGKATDFPLIPGTTVGQVKSVLAASVDESLQMIPGDVKLLHKGKVLLDDGIDLHQLLLPNSAAKHPKAIRLMATGLSVAEAQARNDEFEERLRTAPRVRDDLTTSGRAEIARRRRMGREAMARAAARANAVEGRGQEKYGFGGIETLPNLPDEAKAAEILNSLASDPGILACMAKHEWNVGCLGELYPEGKVGESEVCVMGLNRNKGQKILLRLRTDDLKGFRKILSIRKVLFHELAHNVYSDHDDNFFLLMREIENECVAMDWTQGVFSRTGYEVQDQPSYVGGTFRLGGSDLSERLTPQERAARAAMMRMTSEEKEIQMHCGCGRLQSEEETEEDTCSAVSGNE